MARAVSTAAWAMAFAPGKRTKDLLMWMLSTKMNFVSGNLAAIYNAHTIGIRPEHISIVESGGDWQGTIQLTEHLGADSFLHVEAGEAGRLTVRASGEFAGKPGDTVHLKPDPARVHRFDQNGRAVR